MKVRNCQLIWRNEEYGQVCVLRHYIIPGFINTLVRSKVLLFNKELFLLLKNKVGMNAIIPVSKDYFPRPEPVKMLNAP